MVKLSNSYSRTKLLSRNNRILGKNVDRICAFDYMEKFFPNPKFELQEIQSEIILLKLNQIKFQNFLLDLVGKL